MRKPLLLLVDDDSAVLEALESELAPAFQDICRIETFDDPHAVLDAIARWTDEGRRVAVLIADQKMPALSGVELLASLRAQVSSAPADAFHPARHMSALMLTGYAGLASAMAAKNEGGVERYLEKPWKPDEMRGAVTHALARFVRASGVGRYFEFREVQTPDELRAALRIRFDVYELMSRTRFFLPGESDEHLDVDEYDRFARHFGLFECIGGSRRLAGTLRVVGDGAGPQATVLEELVPPTSWLGSRLRAERTEQLPMLKYLLDRDVMLALIKELLAHGEVVVEPGRLALLPNFREGAAVGVRHLARHIVEGSVGFFFFFFRIMNAILTCDPPHQAIYRPLGFRLATGTAVRFTPGLGTEVACLHGRMDWVPDGAKQRCEEIGTRIARVGHACRCLAFPSCLDGPYGSGDFVSVDVFCPELATRRLSAVPDDQA